MTRACRPLTAWRRLAVPLCAAWLLVPGPAAADTCSGLALGTLPAQPIPIPPVALVAADFDRDGKVDVVTANATGALVSLLLGDGSGGLTLTTATGFGSGPIDIVAGDLDRDGFLDLVVAKSTGSDLELLKGTGTSFGSQTTFNAGVAPARLLLGDFNRDGYPDLVVVSTSGNRVQVFAGNGTVGFGAMLSDLATAAPVAGAAGDFNRDGHLDLAVASAAANQVAVFLGDKNGFLGNADSPRLPIPFATVSTGDGTSPLDLAAGDLNHDGKLDLVTANQGDGTAAVLLGSGDGHFASQTPVAVGGRPRRTTVVDLDRDGALDLVLLDLVGVDEMLVTPRLVAFKGDETSPTLFSATPDSAALPDSSFPRGLAVGDFTSDGRADLVTALSATSKAAVVKNQSGFACARSSFAAAPRSYAVPGGPVSAAAADFDEDGRTDLAVATSDGWIRIRRGAAGDFTAFGDLGPFSPPPRAIATADLDVDGHADLVVAFGAIAAPGSAQAFFGDGHGVFVAGIPQATGTNASAVAIGDFDGSGTPDVAATSEDGGVWVFLGNGARGLSPMTGNPVLSGLDAPRALVAADLTGDGLADLAIAESGASAVHVLKSKVDGGPLAFELVTPVGTGLPVGTHPEGIAVAYLDTDDQLDLVTADGGGTVSVIRRDTGGSFRAAEPYPAGSNPTAVALADVSGDGMPDIAVTTSGSQSLTLRVNDGVGLFTASSAHPVRSYPRAVTSLDADADGQPDLAVVCQNADAVVVLLSRLSPPAVLDEAVRVSVGAGAGPRAAVSVDLDGDGDLDLAVANRGTSTVSLLFNDGNGAFPLAGISTLAVGMGPESIVAGDFNRDGRVDLALNAPLATPSKGISILFASTGTRGTFDSPHTLFPVGMAPDDLTAGDFDRDGDLDLAVCDKVGTPGVAPGYVRILVNDGLGGFSLGQSVAVLALPTAIVAADFNHDGDLDLAVGIEALPKVQILSNTAGNFAVSQDLDLPGTDGDPRSLAVGDFDDSSPDDAVDLAVATFLGDHLYIFRNQNGAFSTTSRWDAGAPYALQLVTTADVNLDGRTDLLAVATGLSVVRRTGTMTFDPAETVVAGWGPAGGAVGDFNGDGWPDVAVVNELSNDVSLLLSTACRARRLEVSVHPAACEMGPQTLYGPDAEVRARDDGGSLAACAVGTVIPSIAAGTGDPEASLGGGGVLGLPLANGVVSFTDLTINRPGRRYRLQFSLAGLPSVQTRTFTLGPRLQILGIPSMCWGGSSSFETEGDYDGYAWTLDAQATPFAFTPKVTLNAPPLALGSHSLAVKTHVDGCAPSVSRPIYVGSLDHTTLAIDGPDAVCMGCIGGTITPTDVGGGPAQSRQWGYRTVSGTGPVTDMSGETGETYLLRGRSFPGPGTYFVVVRTTPSCGPVDTYSSELAVTVLTSGEVQYLGASARGSDAVGGQVDLQWILSAGAADELCLRWNKATDGTAGCAFPTVPDCPTDDGSDWHRILSPATRGGFGHTGLAFDTGYCYTVFVRAGSVWAPGRTIKARPFNADTGPVKWAYSTGATAVVPPVVGTYAVLAMSNDHTVHAVTRGSLNGGFWPTDWTPQPLMGVAHSRSPVVPFPPLVFPSADSVLFVGDDAGWVQAVDAKKGDVQWGPVRPDTSATITGAPGAILRQYGAARDLVLVPTRHTISTNPSALYGLGLTDGSNVGSYNGEGLMGPINGSPAVDYANQRVYVASRSLLGGATLWCAQVQPEPSTPFTTCNGWLFPNVGDVDGSPVIRNGRVYVGNTTGTVYSLDAATGGGARTFSTEGDGPVKGFLFPDRRNDNLFFASNTKVWSISDNGSPTMTKNWEVTGLNPSIVLYRPQSNYVYVGSQDGKLYELELDAVDETAPPTVRVRVLADDAGQIGAPTLDIDPPDVVTPGNKLLVVGSEEGVLYGVEVPLPPT